MKWGPNSNTFTKVLASCCADGSKWGLGWVPGWNHKEAIKCERGEGDSVIEEEVSAETAHGIRAIQDKFDRPTYDTATVSIPERGSNQVGIKMNADYLTNRAPEGSKNTKRAQKNIYGFGKLPTLSAMGGSGYGQDMVYVKGHLLNAETGGPAEDRNLYPINGLLNDRHKRGPEEWVKNKVRGGKLVYYRVTVTNRSQPTPIDIYGDGTCTYYYMDSTYFCDYATYRLYKSGKLEKNQLHRVPVRENFDLEGFSQMLRERGCPQRPSPATTPNISPKRIQRKCDKCAQHIPPLALTDNNIIQRTPKNLPRKDLHVKGILDIAEQKMNRVYFEESSHKVGFLQEMKIASMFIGKNQPKEIFLYGYASEEGSSRFNKRLIRKRLNAVKKLVKYYSGGNVKINTESRLGESKNSYKYREFRAVEISKRVIAATNGVANTKDRDCSKAELAEIDIHRARAVIDVKNALKKVIRYFRVPKFYPDIEALLDFYFGGHDDNVIAHVLQVLKEMKNDLPKLKGNTVLRCAGTEHAYCKKTYALADRQSDILFCPRFFNSKEITFKTRVLIHELGHYIPTYLKDYSYSHSRLFRFTSQVDALKNSDSYTMFINDINKHVIKSKKNTKREPVGDVVNSCGKNQAIVEEALSRAERLNSFAVAGMKQTYANNYNLTEMKPFLKKEFGEVNKYSLAGLYDRSNKLKDVYRGNKFVLNCLSKGSAVCTKSMASILNAKREIDICPTFFTLSKPDQIIAIGAEVTKFIPEIQAKYRKSYVRIGQHYKTHFWKL